MSFVGGWLSLWVFHSATDSSVSRYPKLKVKSNLSDCLRFRAIVLALVLSMAACTGGPRVEISDSGGASKAVVRVEIADTAAVRELGLMFRQRLGRDAGMLFVFKQPQHLTFWMKNTEIPLDMIFAEADGKIAGIVANAEPFSEQQLSVGEESQYVLEVNGGFAQRHGIKPGDRLQFLGARPSAKD
jgi:uncharacterized membrane protein (UPF0127 family)